MKDYDPRIPRELQVTFSESEKKFYNALEWIVIGLIILFLLTGWPAVPILYW